MARHRSVIGFRGSMIDQSQRNYETSASLIAAPARSTMRSSCPQSGSGIALEDSPGTVESLVDALNSDRTAMLDAQLVSDLLWAPTLIEVVLHELAELDVDLEASLLRAGSAAEHQRMGRMGEVLTTR
jgi:hypothetical protein